MARALRRKKKREGSRAFPLLLPAAAVGGIVLFMFSGNASGGVIPKPIDGIPAGDGTPYLTQAQVDYLISVDALPAGTRGPFDSRRLSQDLIDFLAEIRMIPAGLKAGSDSPGSLSGPRAPYGDPTPGDLWGRPTFYFYRPELRSESFDPAGLDAYKTLSTGISLAKWGLQVTYLVAAINSGVPAGTALAATFLPGVKGVTGTLAGSSTAFSALGAAAAALSFVAVVAIVFGVVSQLDAADEARKLARRKERAETALEALTQVRAALKQVQSLGGFVAAFRSRLNSDRVPGGFRIGDIIMKIAHMVIGGELNDWYFFNWAPDGRRAGQAPFPNSRYTPIVQALGEMGYQPIDYNNGRVNSTLELISASGGIDNPAGGYDNWHQILDAIADYIVWMDPEILERMPERIDNYTLSVYEFAKGYVTQNGYGSSTGTGQAGSSFTVPRVPAFSDKLLNASALALTQTLMKDATGNLVDYYNTDLRARNLMGANIVWMSEYIGNIWIGVGVDWRRPGGWWVPRGWIIQNPFYTNRLGDFGSPSAYDNTAVWIPYDPNLILYDQDGNQYTPSPENQNPYTVPPPPPPDVGGGDPTDGGGTGGDGTGGDGSGGGGGGGTGGGDAP